MRLVHATVPALAALSVTAMVFAITVAMPSAALAAVLFTTGAVDGPATPPASVGASATESDTVARLFRERADETLSSAVDVDITLPGLVATPGDLTPGSVPSGARVDSYFLHVDPVGTAGPTRMYTGSVRFDREILGVMVVRDTMVDSTGALGSPSTTYTPDPGKLELSNDTVTLSEDRRTLELSWSASSETDQVRIVTEATPVLPYVSSHAQMKTVRNSPLGDSMEISDPYTLDDPNVLLFFVQNQAGGALLFTPHSAWYDVVGGRWSIRNWDGIDWVDHGFNILVVDPGPNAFVHVTDVGNSSGSVTTLDHPSTNGQPLARLLVNHDAGAGGIVDHTHYIGVRYDDNAAKWTIYNRDGATMALGRSFNVLVLPADDSFVHTGDEITLIDTGFTTLLDHPALNGQRDAVFHATLNLSPGGIVGASADGEILLRFVREYNRWGISVVPAGGITDPLEGVSFNIYVPPTARYSIAHEADAASTSVNYTIMDHPDADGNSAAILLETQNLTPAGGGGAANPESTGLWYTGTAWSIFDQDNLSGYPLGAASNVFQPRNDQRTFVHVANGNNTSGNTSYLDHRNTLDDPDAIVLVTQSWNPTGVLSGVYNDHHIGVWYDDIVLDWAVFNQDGANIPIGASFNVHVAPPDFWAFVHTTTPGNTSGDATSLDHITTNGHPDARLIVTSNWNPGGGFPGIYNDHPVAVAYDSGSDKWQIVNQDAAPMPFGASFNVLRVPEPGGLLGLGSGGALLALLARHSRRRRPNRRAWEGPGTVNLRIQPNIRRA